MIKYLGSKRGMVDLLMHLVGGCHGVSRVMDLFSGACHVSHALRKERYHVVSNDNAAYAAAIARCYIEGTIPSARRASLLVEEMNRLPGKDGYFPEMYCRQSRYFQEANGKKIQAMREFIEKIDEEPTKSILLTALMEAADRVDSTMGHQMAYLKKWASRSHKPIEVKMPVIPPTIQGQVLHLDASEAVASMEVDVVYMDPPYNEHRYRAYYHVWETLCRWDKPEAYGVARKRVDLKLDPSPFNKKSMCLGAMRDVVTKARAKYLIVSYSNEGHISLQDMLELLRSVGTVKTMSFDIERNVQAVTGKHNPQGEWVGQKEVERGLAREFVFLVRCS